MEHGGYGERGEGVGGFRVFLVGCGACGGVSLVCRWKGNEEGKVPSESRLDNGTDPVRRTVRIPRAMSERPRVREK